MIIISENIMVYKQSKLFFFFVEQMFGNVLIQISLIK